MKITYLGHSCFYLQGKNASVVTDPFNSDMVGIPFKKVNADIITVSHHHKDHDAVENVNGEYRMFDVPGEYERRGIRVYGFPSYHDNVNGAERGLNTIFKIVVDEIVIVHLGDLGHIIDTSTVEMLSDADILFIPVGGEYTIGPSEAKKIIATLGTITIIPMHYKTNKLNQEIFAKLLPVDDFLNISDISRRRREIELDMTAETLPEERELVILERK